MSEIEHMSDRQRIRAEASAEYAATVDRAWDAYNAVCREAFSRATRMISAAADIYTGRVAEALPADGENLTPEGDLLGLEAHAEEVILALEPKTITEIAAAQDNKAEAPPDED